MTSLSLLWQNSTYCIKILCIITEFGSFKPKSYHSLPQNAVILRSRGLGCDSKSVPSHCRLSISTTVVTALARVSLCGRPHWLPTFSSSIDFWSWLPGYQWQAASQSGPGWLSVHRTPADDILPSCLPVFRPRTQLMKHWHASDRPRLGLGVGPLAGPESDSWLPVPRGRGPVPVLPPPPRNGPQWFLLEYTISTYFFLDFHVALPKLPMWVSFWGRV